jgi:hypothetical protein
MRPACLLSLVAMLTGCHALRPQIPSLVVEARYEQRDGNLARDAASARKAFALGIALRTSPSPPPGGSFASIASRGDARPAAPCASRALCAWEARARAVQLRRLGVWR